jgi:hypothetical protein
MGKKDVSIVMGIKNILESAGVSSLEQPATNAFMYCSWYQNRLLRFFVAIFDPARPHTSSHKYAGKIHLGGQGCLPPEELSVENKRVGTRNTFIGSREMRPFVAAAD